MPARAQPFDPTVPLDAPVAAPTAEAAALSSTALTSSIAAGSSVGATRGDGGAGVVQTDGDDDDVSDALSEESAVRELLRDPTDGAGDADSVVTATPRDHPPPSGRHTSPRGHDR